MSSSIDRERRKAFVEGPLQEAVQVADGNVSYLDYFVAGGVEGVIIVYEDDSKDSIVIEKKSLVEVGAAMFARLQAAAVKRKVGPGEPARKKCAEDAWKRFGDTTIDEHDCISEPFWLKPGMFYPEGTNRFEIWHDFDELYADWGGVHALAYPDDRQ